MNDDKLNGRGKRNILGMRRKREKRKKYEREWEKDQGRKGRWRITVLSFLLGLITKRLRR